VRRVAFTSCNWSRFATRIGHAMLMTLTLVKRNYDCNDDVITRSGRSRSYDRSARGPSENGVIFIDGCDGSPVATFV